MAVTYTDPQYLWLLLILPLFVITHFYSLKYVKKRAVRLANFEAVKRISGGVKVSVNWTIIIIRLLAITALVLSTAGMVIWYEGQSSNSDYVLAIDASGSMLADDFEPNRLEAAKKAATTFVDRLNGDIQIGVVSFSGIAETEQPLTPSKLQARNAINSIEFKSVHGTAIGDAIKLSTNLLSLSKRPKSVVLLTDGRENVASPSELAKVVEFADEKKVTINTIGVGTERGGVVPGIEITSTIDEKTLRQIANSTGGLYFSAHNNETLNRAYQRIAASSESDVPIRMRIPLMMAALFLIFLEWGFLNTKFRSIP